MILSALKNVTEPRLALRVLSALLSGFFFYKMQNLGIEGIAARKLSACSR
jgi:hypothetical protein